MHRPLNSCSVLAFTTILIAFPGVGIGQDEPKSADSELVRGTCSIFQASVTNSELWIRGDFLLEERIDFDNVKTSSNEPSGIVSTERIKRRVVFDHGRQFYAMYVLENQTVTDFDASKVEPQVTKRLSAWVIDEKGMLSTFTNGERAERQTSAINERLLQDLGFCDLRGFWYRCRFDAAEFNKVKQICTERLTGAGYRSSRRDSSKEHIVFDYPFDPKLATMYRTHRFDLESLMMETNRVHGHLVDGEKCYGPEHEVVWGKQGELYAPVSASCSEYKRILWGGKQHKGTVEQRYEIVWLGLNDEIDLSRFDARSLASEKSVLAKLNVNTDR